MTLIAVCGGVDMVIKFPQIDACQRFGGVRNLSPLPQCLPIKRDAAKVLNVSQPATAPPAGPGTRQRLGPLEESADAVHRGPL